MASRRDVTPGRSCVSGLPAQCMGSVGGSRQAVNRVPQDLAGRGHIRFEGRAVVILDRARTTTLENEADSTGGIVRRRQRRRAAVRTAEGLAQRVDSTDAVRRNRSVAQSTRCLCLINSTVA